MFQTIDSTSLRYRVSATFLLLLLAALPLHAQKIRPDAFPPVFDTSVAKAPLMATTLEQMASWDRYPTHGVYQAMMQRFVDSFPTLCHLDTIGTSVQGRPILSMVISTAPPSDTTVPEFFYSATIHGDELTGFYLMLRLCDTLLHAYSRSDNITRLLDSVRIYINPLANPDGTYRSDDNTIADAWRYNANAVDLNRNYPDPFGTDPLDSIQPENIAMIDYVAHHRFLLGATLHGGSEVFNYPWDSFTSFERQNEHSQWWEVVGKRFVDTCRKFDSTLFADICEEGYITGGDWYVIRNGRQDYFNYTYNLREATLEVSTTKRLPTSRLHHYWQALSHSLIDYISRIFALSPTPEGIVAPATSIPCKVFPNPTRGPVTIETPTATYRYDLSNQPSGVHIVTINGFTFKIVKM